jgi:hypothetical protein
MARSTVTYDRQYINNAASTSPTGSVEAVTGLPIQTGVTVGTFFEISAAEAAQLSYTPWGTLYDGIYMWVKLDPTVVTAPIPLGTAVSWLTSSETAGQATQVTTLNTTTNADFAGVTIDSNFGATNPYAFICVSGKVSALFDSSPATAFGDVVGLSTGTQGSVTRQGTSSQALTGLSLGHAIQVGSASSRALIRITNPISRF